MKKFFSSFQKFIRGNQDKISPIESKNINSVEKTIRISDEFELNVKGLPNTLNSKEQNQIIKTLLKNGLSLSKDRVYRKGDNVFHGKATLKLREKVHQIEYTISALKVLQALSVYKEAFDYVNQGAEEGLFDYELAAAAADFFKESARKEVFGNSGIKQKVKTNENPVKTKELSTSQHTKQEDQNHGT